MANFYNSNNPLAFLPPVTRNLLMINVLVWLVCGLFKQTWIAGLMALYVGHDFHLYQLVTYMFTHIQFDHLFFNMFALFMFGRALEDYWGSKRFLIYYMVTGIGAGLVQLAVFYLQGEPAVAIGASGAVFGLLLAFGMLFPNLPLYLMFIPVPIKAKYMVIGYGVIEFFMGIANRSGDNVAHFAHLGGMLFGIFMILYWKYGKGNFNWFNKKRPKTNSNNYTQSYKTNFSDEIDQLLDKVKQSGYNSLSDYEKKKLFDASKK